MADDLKAVALTAPEPAGWKQMMSVDWERFGKHASLPAIEHLLKQARADQRKAQRAVQRLEALASQRAAQITAGEWPPKVERVTWRDLKPGDVALHLYGAEDTLIEKTETEQDERGGERTTAWFRNWLGLCSQSAPADQEVTIRPRATESASA